MDNGHMDLGDKTMDDKLVHILQNDNKYYSFYRLKLFVEKFGQY